MDNILSLLITFVFFWVTIEVVPSLAKRIVLVSLKRRKYVRSLMITNVFMMEETGLSVVKTLKARLRNVKLSEMDRDELTEIIGSLSLIPGTGNFDYIVFIDEAKERKDIGLMYAIARYIPSKAWKTKVETEARNMNVHNRERR